ncbi:hypothetical protein SAICODRAFT_51393, partial [Saitoella complicata NRRL Y-17804]
MRSIPPRRNGDATDAAQYTLKEQENLLSEMKKENFSLKLKIFYLEERMQNMAPENIDKALKESIEFKVERTTLQRELQRHKKFLMEAEKSVARLQEEARS